MMNSMVQPLVQKPVTHLFKVFHISFRDPEVSSLPSKRPLLEANLSSLDPE
jgi:hypothetical protein